MIRTRQLSLALIAFLLCLGITGSSQAEAWIAADCCGLFYLDLDSISTSPSPFAVVSQYRPLSGPPNFLLRGLAQHPSFHSLWAAGFVGKDTSLGMVDEEIAAYTEARSFAGHHFVDIAFDSASRLWALSSSCDSTDPSALFQIDLAAGTATKRASFQAGSCFSDTAGAVTFNSFDSFLYVYVVNLGAGGPVARLKRVNPSTLAMSDIALQSTFNYVEWMRATSASTLRLTDDYQYFDLDLTTGHSSLVGYAFFQDPFFGPQVAFSRAASPATAACVPTSTAACVGGRFKVEVTWDATLNGGGTGPAHLSLESSDTVKFTFFDPGNVELILKVLNGCGLNNRFWVFAGGATDLGVAIRITDTRTGTVRTYTNERGVVFHTIDDTSAFGC